MSTRRRQPKHEEPTPDDEKRRAEVEADLWKMVEKGLAHWSGGKPKGSNPPITITPGPPVSDLIHEMRR